MRDRFRGALDDLQETVLYCPQAQVEDCRRRAVEVDSKISCIEDILGLEYEDVTDEE